MLIGALVLLAGCGSDASSPDSNWGELLKGFFPNKKNGPATLLQAAGPYTVSLRPYQALRLLLRRLLAAPAPAPAPMTSAIPISGYWII